jgi:hypothetical protein
MPNAAQTRNTTWSVPAQTPKAPRTPAVAEPQPLTYNAVGFGQRALWTYPPIGEAAQRDPHKPDPTPGLDRKPQSQANASPPARSLGWGGRTWRVAGGSQFNGLAPTVTYIKIIGSLITRSLARNYLSGVQESRWRVGGVSYPLDFGYGPGYVGDSQTLWLDNPQAYLRNPGIFPLTNAPATYRVAPNMPAAAYYGWLAQTNGPGIGDVGNTVPIGSRV